MTIWEEGISRNSRKKRLINAKKIDVKMWYFMEAVNPFENVCIDAVHISSNYFHILELTHIPRHPCQRLIFVTFSFDTPDPGRQQSVSVKCQWRWRRPADRPSVTPLHHPSQTTLQCNVFSLHMNALSVALKCHSCQSSPSSISDNTTLHCCIWMNKSVTHVTLLHHSSQTTLQCIWMVRTLL